MALFWLMLVVNYVRLEAAHLLGCLLLREYLNNSSASFRLELGIISKSLLSYDMWISLQQNVLFTVILLVFEELFHKLAFRELRSSLLIVALEEIFRLLLLV